jgi:alpha-acetolactate decarboxylase
MNTPTYTWIQNAHQFGTQTEEGMWHSVPCPHLVKQIKKEGYSVQFPSDQYWHPDYVIFKGRTDSGTGWFIGQRTAGVIDPGHHGPFKTKGMAKRAVLGGE